MSARVACCPQQSINLEAAELPEEGPSACFGTCQWVVGSKESLYFPLAFVLPISEGTGLTPGIPAAEGRTKALISSLGLPFPCDTVEIRAGHQGWEVCPVSPHLPLNNLTSDLRDPPSDWSEHRQHS